MARRPRRRKSKKRPLVAQRPGGTGLRNPNNTGKRDAAKNLGSMFVGHKANLAPGKKNPSVARMNNGQKVANTGRDSTKGRRRNPRIKLGL